MTAYPFEKIEASAKRKERRIEKVAENVQLESLATTGRLRTSVLVARKQKRQKSPSLSKLKRVLWGEISLLVRSWSNVCISCGGPVEVAAHIVPSNESAITRYFLPNLYPCCKLCNGLEKWNRATWVFHHKDMFGDDYVSALYQLAADEDKKPLLERFQIKKHWVLEQTERIRRLRG